MNTEVGRSIMCRACMKVDGVLLPMYGDDMISKKNLPDKLADLASIQIDKHDGLPTVLCAKCAYRTDSFYDFKLQVQATEKKLRKMFLSSNAQNISLKSEATSSDCEGDIHSNVDVLPEEKPNSPKNEDQLYVSAETQLENKFKVDIEPSLEIKQSEEEVCLIDANEQYEETINFVDDQLTENVGLSALQNLDHIFISDISNIIEERQNELQGTKEEVPEGIQEIFQTDNLGYTFLYIPNEEVSDIEAQNVQDAIHMEEEEGEEEDKKVYACDPNEDAEIEEIIEERDSPSELVTWSPEDSRNDEESVMEKGKWSPNISYAIIEKDDVDEAAKPKHKNCKSNSSKTPKNNEDSDSDYFVDPQDNLLGSLNDTIMRIKEIKVEGDEINYQCTLCMQNYDKLAGVLIHTVDNHVPITGPFFCVVCEKDCESHRDLRSHVKTHSGRFPYTCFICNKAYSMKRYLKRHMACHTDFPRHRCPKCGMRFSVKTELETHVQTHVHGGAPFACSQCPRVFNHKGNFRRHLISHLDPHGLRLPKYPCEVCGKRFLNNRTLETHRRVHTGEKPFQCDICSRSFSQQGNLLNHLRIHSNPRSYTCEVCGKRFNQRATLRDHSLIHTGEKPYVCNVCGVAFTFSAALRRHMWRHATDKPFACEICNARFVGKYDIKRHMKIHTDRPKTKRRRNQSRNDEIQPEITTDEAPIETQISNDTTTVFIEHQVLLAQDPTQIERQEEAEKENVDALFNLIQYG